MDNVTHSLAGLLVGEAAVQGRRLWAGRRGAARGGPPAPDVTSAGFGQAAALAAVVAANLPDADVLYAAVALDKLGSLLHHRGYTHTLLAAVAGALLVWAAALAVWRSRRRGAPLPAADRAWLLAAVTVAVASHVTLDFTNSYGVHPFSPARDTWHYGDAVFIVEPWLWVAAVPPLLFAARRRAARVGLGGVLAGGLVLAWAVPLVSRVGALALTGGALVALGAAWRSGPVARVAAGVAGWLAVELVFGAGTRAARAQVAAAAAAATDAAAGPRRLVDLVMTPAPANPLCVRALAVEVVGPRGGERYQLTTAWAAAAPALVPAARCRPPARAADRPSLAMRPAARPPTAGVQWERSWDAPLAELVALDRGNCHVAALLRFARVPFWFPVDANTLHVGDLRYDRDRSVGFAEFRVPARPTRCPDPVPPWRPPRAELLTGD